MRNDFKDIKFGTDGWRGVIGDTYTFHNLRIVSQAVADFVGGNKSVAVGYDTRFMSADFAAVVSEVLANNGIRVSLSDRAVSTPILSFATKVGKFDLGVMITASHNPAQYNGFKIKTTTGGAAGPEVTAKIEALLGKNPVKETNVNQAKISQKNFSLDYVRFVRGYIDFEAIKRVKFRILVDAMYGSGNGFIADILKGSPVKVELMRNTINPSFGGRRPEPIEENLQELKSRVKKENFDLGIALDGDADRIAAVAPGGKFIHPQKILGLLALHLNQGRKWSGGIVKTIAGTTMIDKIAAYLGVRLYETPVGFKYISNLMEKEDIVAGGEEAGGMGVKGYIPERDGTVAGLLLLEMMAYRKKDILGILTQVEKQFGRYYYLRKDMGLDRPVQLKKEFLPEELLGKKVVLVKDFDGFKMICEDESWLMLRSSGTEPVVRIYAESKSQAKSRQLIDCGENLIRKNVLLRR